MSQSLRRIAGLWYLSLKPEWLIAATYLASLYCCVLSHFLIFTITELIRRRPWGAQCRRCHWCHQFGPVCFNFNRTWSESKSDAIYSWPAAAKYNTINSSIWTTQSLWERNLVECVCPGCKRAVVVELADWGWGESSSSSSSPPP